MRRQGSNTSPHEPTEAELLGRRIRRAREDQGLKQEELSFAVGVSRRLLQQVERGKPTVRMDSLLKILHGLALTLEVVPRALRRRVEPRSADEDE